ncbi:MAG: sorbosone dehydrogenase [Pirellulales bacterium]
MLRYAIPLCLVFAAASVFAQNDLKDIPPVDPEIERATFKLPEGFEVNLFAADPLLAKPIQINWDSQGRLWAATSETYPQVEPGKPANDKIIILSDENHDGVADKTTVFADGLLIPTGVLPGDGGAYVANSTELLHLKDTDGDGKADKKTIVLSGFGTEDTHHIIHTFRWSPRGTMFFAQSIYIHSHIETPHGVKILNAGGFWEYDPRTQKLGIFARGLVNAWGIAWDKQGNMFATDGAGNEGINFVFPGSVMTTASNAERVVKGLNPGSPKHCGLEIVGSPHFPDDWQGDMITSDFRAHRVCRFKLSDDGSGFASKEMQEVIKSNHPSFRPIDAKLGPDGALYIADWYNPIIQHGEVDFRDPRRDKTHGRIWRVTYKGRPLNKPVKLDKLELHELAELVDSPDRWLKDTATLLFQRKIADIEAQLDKTRFNRGVKLDDKTLEVAGKNPNIARQLRVLVSRFQFDFDQPEDAIWWNNHLTRVNEDRVIKFADLDSTEGNTNNVYARTYGKLLQSKNPRIRLLMLIELANEKATKEGRSSLAGVATTVLDLPMDRFLDFALWQALRELSPAWLAELEAGKNPFAKPSHLAHALSCVAPDKALPALRVVIDKKLVPDDALPQFQEMLYVRGSANDLVAEIDRTDWKSAPAADVVRRLDLMLKVAAKNPAAPKNAEKLIPLVDHADPAVKRAAYRLVGQWRGGDVFEKLRATFADSAAPTELRIAAAQGLIHNPAATPLLREAAEADMAPAQLHVEVVALLLPRDVNAGSSVLAKLLANDAAGDALETRWAEFLSVKNVPVALEKALAGATLPADSARSAARAIKRLPQQHSKLLAAISKAGKNRRRPARLDRRRKNGDPRRAQDQGRSGARGTRLSPCRIELPEVSRHRRGRGDRRSGVAFVGQQHRPITCWTRSSNRVRKSKRATTRSS